MKSGRCPHGNGHFCDDDLPKILRMEFSNSLTVDRFLKKTFGRLLAEHQTYPLP